MSDDRERQRLEKERQAQILYMKKIEEETQRKKDAQEMIGMLEYEEKQLISRLRQTQYLQEKVSLGFSIHPQNRVC